MQNVADVDTVVQESGLTKAIVWGRSKAKNWFQGSAAPQMARCLERLLSVLDLTDERSDDLRYYRDPQLFLEDIEALCNRYVRRHDLDDRTFRNYRLKATRLLTEFLRWDASPSTYKGPENASRRAPRAKKSATASPAVASKPPVAPAPSVSAVRVFDSMRDFPLGNGSKFLFQLPDDEGISQSDFDRISQHLQSFVVPSEPAATPA